MEEVSAIATAFTAGAIAVSQGIGGPAVKDAYRGIKKILEDRYAFVTSGLVDADPKNDAFKGAFESEIAGKSEALEDLSVQALTGKLLDVLASLSYADSIRAGVDVRRIRAGRDLVVSSGWIRGDNFESERDSILTAYSAHGDSSGKA
ncbi:hypothetical protein ACC756_28000 [Rhizobium ruizarguesonis]